jgi:hypothetical protein
MEVYKAISLVIQDLAKEGISKDQSLKEHTKDSKGVWQEKTKYKFRGIDDVYNSLAPLLAKHKLSILPRVQSRSVIERTTLKGTVLFYVTVEVEYDLVSSEDGSKHTIKTFGEAMDSGDKATNKAMSAAFKYACLQSFCIPTEGDNDADATEHKDIESEDRKKELEKLRRIQEEQENIQKEHQKKLEAKRSEILSKKIPYYGQDDFVEKFEDVEEYFNFILENSIEEFVLFEKNIKSFEIVSKFFPEFRNLSNVIATKIQEAKDE